MDWQEIYQSRLCSAEEAIKTVKSGDRIFLTGNCSVPQKLISALVAYAPNLSDVEICQPLTVSGSEYVHPHLEGHLRVNTLFISANVREAVQSGKADFTPVLLSELPLLFKKNLLPIDVAFVHLSPPDKHGYCTYGVESGLMMTSTEKARIIIAEVNRQMPRVLGDTFIHVSKLDYIVPVDYPLAEISMEDGSEPDVMDRIGGHIAELIPNGATLQLGIGAIPGAILKYLDNKRDLGIHTELFSDGIIRLVEAGIVNGSRKTLHPGKIVAGFALGSNALYRWVDDNPLIELHKTEYVNNPFVIAQNARMAAINSAIEIDLTGQVCADSIGAKFFSGVGGQMDFIYGAAMSEGGLPIIAMPSTVTTRDGRVFSRIVPTLKPGAGVTTTRNHVHYIATEYGIVDLYGKSIRQRVHLLASIAHPQFRDQLIKSAGELKYI